MSTDQPLSLVATCALGLETLLADELSALGVDSPRIGRGSVTFRGSWPDVWRANICLRTANRVLVRLAQWPAGDDRALAHGARQLVNNTKQQFDGVSIGTLFDPRNTFSLRATSSRSSITDTRWVSLKVKDGLVDGQRDRFGERSSIDREDPVLPLRVWMYEDWATLSLDTSGAPLDRRGYRVQTVMAPVREQLGAACVLASGWDGRGPVVDPMCGSGTLLVEAAWFALGIAPGKLRGRWAFQQFPGFDERWFKSVRNAPLPCPGPDVQLHGVDSDPPAARAARTNLARAGLAERNNVSICDAFDFQPPPEPGLVLVNPAYGERLASTPEQWRALGDLFKQRYKGWTAVVLAGDKDKGKFIGLRAARKLTVKNGPLDARILVFKLY